MGLAREGDESCCACHLTRYGPLDRSSVDGSVLQSGLLYTYRANNHVLRSVVADTVVRQSASSDWRSRR